MNGVVIHPEVEEALFAGKPVVALESAVLTTGLPREARDLSASLNLLQWNDLQPVNLELARQMMRIIREGGGVPAMVGVLEGVLFVGLEEDQVERLALDEGAGKASVANLASVMADGSTAGTTVSATLVGCMMPEQGPIRVFATGGIGGVHRGWADRPDISADMLQIAKSPVCVVCAGAKSILDLSATLEGLETLGIPVVGYQCDWLPQFYGTGEGGLGLSQRVDAVEKLEEICQNHWEVLGFSGGIVAVSPVAGEYALDDICMNEALKQAEEEADRRGISGPARTPFMLGELARLTEGRSLIANIALLLNNAKLATRLAVRGIHHRDPENTERE